MYLKSSFLSRCINIGTMVIVLTGILISSCRKDMEVLKPPTIQFTSTSLVIDQNAIEPLTAMVNLSLSSTLETAGIVIIAIDSSSTATESDYTTDPVDSSGFITLNLAKGATNASFKVTPTSSIVGNKTIVFKVISATGGILLANSDISTIVTIKKGTSRSGSIITSVASIDDFGRVDSGTVSASKTYTLTSNYLTSDISVVASDHFQVSLDNATFSDSLGIDFNKANAGSVDIFVQFKPSTGTNQDLTGTITHSSPGATDKVVIVSGTESGNIVGNLIFGENFDYGTSPGNLTSVSSWKNYSGTGTPVQYVVPGLNFAGYGSSVVSGAVTIENGSGSREDVTRPFTSQTSGTFYTAQLLNVASAEASTSGTGGDFPLSVRDSSGNYFNRIYAKDDGSGKLSLGVARNISGSGLQVYSTTAFNYNTTYLLVIKYDFSTKETSMFIITGTIPATEPASPDVVANTGTEPGSFDNIIIRQSTHDLSATIDGVRIANTWKDVLGL